LVVGTILTEYNLALRVLNDDVIGEGMGFETPHDNMEIITIPLEGDLAQRQHGNAATIKNGDVQVMRCRNTTYSEFNLMPI
jgi:redox-sensitive bicupin YhaK (pirin superfamily)